MSGRSLCLCVALLGVATIAPSARADEELERFVERNRILVQKLQADVNTAVTQSRTLERTDPESAKAVLQRALTRVQATTLDLSADERNRMTGLLQARLRAVAAVARQPRPPEPRIEPARAPRAAPPGPSAIARDAITSANQQLRARDRQRLEAARGVNGVLDGIQAAAIPTDADVTYPKDWQARSERRKQTVGPRMTPKEVALVKALNSVLSVEFKGTSFKDALNYLQDRTGQAIIVDQGSLRDAMIEYDDPVTLSVKKVTFRTILRKILADRGLAYVVQQGTIQVMTHEKARQQMVVRSYPVDDLIGPNQLSRMFGPFVARAQMQANAQNLVNMIQSSVDPSLWNGQAGGSIQFHEPSMSLIIRAPAEFHYQLAGGGLFGAR